MAITFKSKGKHKQQVHQDIKFLEQCYLRGHHSVQVHGKIRRFLIDGPYLRVTSVKETTNIEEGEPVGYFIAPGGWINTYEEHGNLFFAEIEETMDRHLMVLRAQLIQEVAQQREATPGASISSPPCPKCRTPMHARGRRKRSLQTQGDQYVTLKRTYFTCPDCGYSFFSPG